MRRAFAQGLGLAAFLAAGASWAAEPMPGLRPLFGSSAPTTPQPAPTPAPAPKPVVSISPQTMVDALRAERDAYARRLDVCTQLRRVAAELNDDRLAQRALDIEKMAEEVYQERITRLGVKAELRTLSPSALQALKDSAKKLDSELGSGVAVTPLSVPAPKTDDKAQPATATRLQFREVPQQ